MNTHEHLSIEILADYAEGLLGDADATSVAEQLASCADCQAEADLLVSLGQILAADDPGPMPAHYAARIDAALADLAAAEPVTPKTRTTTAGAGATVIDLASRRRFTPAARVTSVAASLVLLIGGVALGMQALDTSDSEIPGGGIAGEAPGPVQTEQPTAADRAALYASVTKPTGKAVKKLKNGAVADKATGAVFIRNKVLFPDGTVVVHKKSGDAEVTTQSRSGQPITTFVSRDKVKPTTSSAPSTPDATPAATPEPTPEPTPRVEPSSAPQADPYVKGSGDAYSADNFAVKIQGLLRDSGNEIEAPVSSQSSDNVQPATQNRASTGALRSDDTAVAVRGPGGAELAAKVKRCATQLGLTDLLAGDSGTWKSQAATIVVVRNPDNAKQAVGYVVYGECTKEAPATKASVQWEQRVDLPTKAEEEPTPAPTSTPAPSETLPSVATNMPATSLEQ
jgi:hypothetical protein